MIRTKWLALVLLFLSGMPCTAQVLVPTNNVVPVQVSFEQRLFNSLAAESNNSNFSFSPYGIQQVLSKLAVIASPEAKAEIDRVLGGRPLPMLPPPTPSAKTLTHRLDLLMQENEGYGLKVSQLSPDLLARGLNNGDLIFRVNGQVVRSLKDYQQLLPHLSNRDVELSGYNVKTGEPFFGLRVPVTVQSKSIETTETASKTAIICDLSIAENAAALFNTQPATPDFKLFSLQKMDLQELTTFLGPGGQPVKFDRERRDTLAVVNLVRIDGKWQYPFDSEVADVYHGKSGAQRIPYLERVATFETMRNADFEQVVLPIRDTTLRMRFCLPNPNRFDAARSTFCSRQIAWQSHEQRALVKLRVPRFDMNSRIAVEPLLEKLNLASLMRAGSFFSGVAKVSPCTLSTFDQQMSLSVHAKGVQATAQTTAIVSGMGSVPGARELTFNRPFLFALEDSSGTVIIAGQYLDP